MAELRQEPLPLSPRADVPVLEARTAVVAY